MNELVRLRRLNRIAGYRRTEGNLNFYSPDLYSWNGIEIQYEVEDYFSGARDRNSRMLFSNDIVNYTLNGVQISCELVKDDQLGTFFLFDRENDELIRLDNLIKDREIVDQIEWVSFVFIQEEDGR